MADKIALASKSFEGFINRCALRLAVTHVTAEELKTITKVFKDGKVAGADNIPISIIIKTLDLISDPAINY